MQKNQYSIILLSLLVIMLLLSGCSNPSIQPTFTLPAPTVLAPTEQATPTPPLPANKVWLVSGTILTEEQVSAIQNLAEQSGLILEQLPAITEQDLQNRASEVKALIIFPPDPGLAKWAASYPQITFIPIGINSPPTSPNVYPILPDGLHPAWEAYLAGYVAATITDDSRIGAIVQTGSEEGLRRSEGFVNGGVMFCGLCNPIYPPYEDYPLSLEIPAGSTQAEWQPIVDAFLQKQVKTAYVDPAVATPELMLYLAQYGVKLISTSSVPPGLEPAWIAVIQTDYVQAIQAAWQDMQSQTPAGTYPVGMTVQVIDSAQLTEGKLRWLQRVISDLTSGYLIP